jgi:hypothetical protein
MRGVKCHKSLWLYKYKPELRTPPDDFQQAIFDMGTDIGLYARNLLPGGQEIKYEGSTFKQKVRQTQEYIKNGTKTIYEATFLYDDIIVMVDILHKGDRGWELYEVKGATSVKEEYLNDVSVQYYVLAGSGLPVSKTFLVYLNNEYVRQGDINISELFNMDDLTQEVEGNQVFITDELFKMRSMIESSCPHIDIGPQCSSPYDCDFSEYCWKHIPENSVFDLKERGINKFEYYYKGMVKFNDLDLHDLNFKQRMQVESELYDTTNIDVKGLKEFLDMLHYPQHFLDFETFMPPIPLYNGTRPYQPIPFQYSLHVVESDKSDIKHYEFLAEAGIDPREKIVINLINLIPDNACIIAYNCAYEKGRLKDLAEQFPQYADKLLKMCNNMVDLMILFRRRHYYTKEMKGSYSMKYVLPALVPELSYTGMAVSDGSAAMNIYSALHLIKDKDEIEKIRQDLLEYCKLDTLGMVKLIKKLKEVCKNS